jgi:hypothetical protein
MMLPFIPLIIHTVAGYAYLQYVIECAREREVQAYPLGCSVALCDHVYCALLREPSGTRARHVHATWTYGPDRVSHYPAGCPSLCDHAYCALIRNASIERPSMTISGLRKRRKRAQKEIQQEA